MGNKNFFEKTKEKEDEIKEKIKQKNQNQDFSSKAQKVNIQKGNFVIDKKEEKEENVKEEKDEEKISILNHYTDLLGSLKKTKEIYENDNN